MAETKKDRREREANEAFRSVWEQPGRKAPVVEEKTPEVLELAAETSGVEAARSRKTLYWTPVLAWVQDHGFTHPTYGGWLQLPREFDAILAMERKAVAQVVLEIMRRTLGWVDQDGDVDDEGQPKRVEWARVSFEHLTNICGGSPSQARIGLKIALDRKYIERQRIKGHKGGGYAYRIHWNTPRTSTE